MDKDADPTIDLVSTDSSASMDDVLVLDPAASAFMGSARIPSQLALLKETNALLLALFMV